MFQGSTKSILCNSKLIKAGKWKIGISSYLGWSRNNYEGLKSDYHFHATGYISIRKYQGKKSFSTDKHLCLFMKTFPIPYCLCSLR